MATDIVNGLFGPSAAEMREAQELALQQRANAYGAMSPEQRINAGNYALGARLGQMGAGLLGGRDPMVEEAKRRAAVMGTPGTDLGSSKGWLAKADEFRRAGDLRTATMLFLKGKELAKQEQLDALNAAKEEREYALALKALNPDADKLPNNVIEYQFAVNQGYKGTFEQWMRDKKDRDGGNGHAPYSVPVYTAEGVMGFNTRNGQLSPLSVGGNPVMRATDDPTLQGRISSAEQEGKVIGEKRGNIAGAQNALESVATARNLLKRGIYTGAYANVKQMAAKGIPGVDKTKAANTEQFLSEIGNVIVPRLKEFGGNDSNEELRYLQSIMGGNIKSEPAALEAILNSAEAKIRRGLRRVERGMSPDGVPTAPAAPTVDVEAAARAELARRRGGR